MTKSQNFGRFLGEYLFPPITTGSIAPSSPHLAKVMVDWINLPSARTVLEYGPGTGAFTGHIVGKMRPEAKFAAIELNDRFAGIFRQRHPGLPQSWKRMPIFLRGRPSAGCLMASTEAFDTLR